AIIQEGPADAAADAAFAAALRVVSSTGMPPTDEQARKAEADAAEAEARRVEEGSEESEKAVAISKLSTAAKVRLATLGNAIARSKGVPSALTKAAQSLEAKRGPK